VLKRPSTRRRSQPTEITVNLVPMLDALVTLIAFLMYTMAFLALTMVESPLPIVSDAENQQQLTERPLQLTLTVREHEVLLWSPFDLIPQTVIKNRSEDDTPDTLKIHETLMGIKQKFPNENKIIFIPRGDTSYDVMIQVLDAARNLEKTDLPIVVPNLKTGVQEQAKQLFGEVIFGNLLGDDPS
jgi:biopolymer transport protein ExbD